MNRTLKQLCMIGVFAGFSLFYVHIQVSLVDLSYSIDKKNKILVQKGEDFRQLKYELDHLKSPEQLAAQMTKNNLPLELPKEVFVIEIPDLPTVEPFAVEQPFIQPFSKGFLDFFGRWVKVAQAKPES